MLQNAAIFQRKEAIILPFSPFLLQNAAIFQRKEAIMQTGLLTLNFSIIVGHINELLHLHIYIPDVIPSFIYRDHIFIYRESCLYKLGDQMEIHLVQNRKENCDHDHITFNVKGNGNIVFSVYVVFIYWECHRYILGILKDMHLHLSV